VWRGLVEEVAVKYNTMQVHRLILRLWLGFILAALGSVAWAQSLANLESPSPDSFVESGIGLIRGWVCQADRIDVSINNGPRQEVAYGTRRADTTTVCGHPNTGFGLTFPWYVLGEGVHNLRAFADDVEFANVNFTIATLGAEDFLTGLRGEYTLADFPVVGHSPKVRWSEPHQNFVFARARSIPNAPPVSPHTLRAALESPTQGSFESGIGLIRGWVCDAEQVEISINNRPFQAIAYGTRRADTISTCGDANNGFGLTFNWNTLGDDVHRLRARADGVDFADVNFAVTTLGGPEFLTGLRREYSLGDFPSAGQTTEVRWSEPHQNFIVARTSATAPKAGILSAITDRANRFAGLLAGPMPQDDAIGMRAAKDADGQPTQVTGFTWADPKNGASADLELTDNGLPAVYRDPTGTEARLSNITANTVDVGFFRDGQAVAPPVTVPVNGGFLQTLGAFVNQFRSAAQSAEARASGWIRLTTVDQGIVPPASAANVASRRFSLNGLFVNTLWIGGVATGETLCAVQRAADATGLLGQIAARAACQSPTVDSFLELANILTTQADSPFDRIDPILQQVCRFEEDVAEAPCGPTDSNAACLTPATEEVQERQFAAGPPIPPETEEEEEPPPAIPAAPQNVNASDGTFPDRIRITWSAVANAEFYEVYRSTSSHDIGPLVGASIVTLFDDADVMPETDYWYRVKACNQIGCSEFSNLDSGHARQPEPTFFSYDGQSTICFMATADFGVRGVCPERCASSGVRATIQNGTLKLDTDDFSLDLQFDPRGNCTQSAINRAGEIPITAIASNGEFTFSYNIFSGGVAVGTVTMRGFYNETLLSASGMAHYSVQGVNGPVSVDFREDINLQSSAR
jgi:hypothetical protein